MSLSLFPDSVLIFLTAFYVIVVGLLTFGLTRLRYDANKRTPFVSVIVAARNEGNNIAHLLRHLLAQSYPHFEVLLVNDRSTDNTGAIISSFASGRSNLRRIDIQSLESDLTAKKNALTRGIRESRGEILCFTDADCLPPPSWISELVSLFTPSVGMVAGYSPYDDSILTSPPSNRDKFASLLQTFIAYEELKGAAWSAGSIGLRKGWLCTGRNLAYRRAVFEQVGGFRKIRHSISGDDDLFLQLVARETNWEIRYATSPASFVPTAPPRTFPEFISQRVRHFSAGKHFTRDMKLFFLLFHASNLSILAGGVFSFLSGISYELGWIVFGAKTAIDASLFLIAARLFRAWRFSASFLLMEILYIFYNTFVGPLGFLKRFEWKPD